MSDDPITRLNAALEGRYRIERELGEGGMATVYLADDLKHERKVALKVLKPELAAVVGAERFLAEIKTTANLQHPHILPLFDSGEADGFLFYVMPYVEGESLRDRLDRDVQLPVDEAVRIATAVANAVGYAHRQGIIHRDIKPENVLMHEGEPLVSDFGIALAVTAAGGNRMTETGLSLGTPFYMSPEQASADRELGPQSDVYSVGCMLYEMLVGEPPHTGKTAQSVLAKILTERPRSITEMRGTVPSHMAAAVSRSLERLPADRFESAEEFVRALGDTSFTHEVSHSRGAASAAAPQTPPTRARSPLPRFLPWGVAAAALALSAWSMLLGPAQPAAPTLRMTLSDFVVDGVGVPIAISRDGSTVVAGGENDMLNVRRSDDTEFRPIAGTAGGSHPAISPDGEWVAFRQGDELVKVQIGGGPVLPIATSGIAPHWYTQEEIVYRTTQGLVRVVSSAGGTPRDLGVEGLLSPFMLPGGRGLLGHDGGMNLYLHDLTSGERTVIAQGGSNGRYLPTGHIIYGDQSLQSVLAVPFDLSSMQVTGDPVPLLPSVRVRNNGETLLTVSENGTLVQVLSTRGGGSGQLTFTWIDMDGGRSELPLREPEPTAPRVSPDGTRFAYLDGSGDHIWVYNLQTGERTQVTESEGAFPTAAWSLDGSRLHYSVSDGAGYRWMSTAVDGSGDSEVLVAQAAGRVNTISPDGRWLIGEGVGAPTTPDIVYAELGADDLRLQTYLRADWHEEDGEVSPDGDWLAYQATEGGTHAIYIRSFPEPGPVVRLSETNSGPVWSPAGDAVYYIRDDTMVRRAVRLGDAVELGEEAELFRVTDWRGSNLYRGFDIHPDGDRFLFITSGALESEAVESYQGVGNVVVVANWFEELRRRMGERR